MVESTVPYCVNFVDISIPKKLSEKEKVMMGDQKWSRASVSLDKELVSELI